MFKYDLSCDSICFRAYTVPSQKNEDVTPFHNYTNPEAAPDAPSVDVLRSKNTKGREVIIDAAVDLQVRRVDGVARVHPVLLSLVD
jgi:hypothetical protein